MQALEIALIQMAWAGSRAEMIAQTRGLIAAAAGGGARLICLPEFTLSPYFAVTTDAAGFEWAEALPGGESEQFFSQQAAQHGVYLIGSLYERTPDGQYFDTATIHAPDGSLCGITRKVHIPSGTGYHETYFFGGADEYPVHDIGACKLAAPTCYDQWFPELARIYALNGAEFIFYPTAIGSEPTAPEVDSSEAWEIVMRGHAIANGLFIGAANRVGDEHGQRFYGGSFVCDPTGRVLAKAGRDTTEVIFATLQPETLNQWRELFPLLHQRRPEAYARLLDKKVESTPPAWLGQETKWQNSR